jgi:hypothetical protein
MSEKCHKRKWLPDNASDANAIIRELQHLVDMWLHVEEPTPSKVVSLVRDKDHTA